MEQHKSTNKPEIPNRQPEKQTEVPKIHKESQGQNPGNRQTGAQGDKSEEKNETTQSNPQPMHKKAV